VDFDIDLNIKLSKIIVNSNMVWERIRKRTFELVVEDLSIEINQEWGPEYTRVVSKVLTAVRKTSKDYAVKESIKEIVIFFSFKIKMFMLAFIVEIQIIFVSTYS
jgi:hypothetical protein